MSIMELAMTKILILPEAARGLFRVDAVEKVFFDRPTNFFRAAGAFCAPRR